MPYPLCLECKACVGDGKSDTVRGKECVSTGYTALHHEKQSAPETRSRNREQTSAVNGPRRERDGKFSLGSFKY